jgi:broad specificity phosphatase PhoE
VTLISGWLEVVKVGGRYVDKLCSFISLLDPTLHLLTGYYYLQVFSRVEDALHSLVEQAAETENSCLAAITHSSYLRVLLLCLQDKSLLEYSVMQQGNCCINVLDLKKNGATRTLTGKSILVGARAPSDFVMKTSLGNVVRVNEIRHLIGVK